MHTVLKGIMERGNIRAENLAKKININPTSLRRMLRGEVKMNVDTFNDALGEMGYKIMIVKKDDLI